MIQLYDAAALKIFLTPDLNNSSINSKSQELLFSLFPTVIGPYLEYYMEF